MSRKLLVLLGVSFLAVPAAIFANTTISHGYLSPQSVQAGWLVSSDPNPGIIQPANVENAHSLIGVVMGLPGAVFTVTTAANEVQVATSGIVPAMVTSFNGDIKVGDKITASPISGVGMKTSETAKIVGVAQASFDAKMPGAVKTKLKDKSGKDLEVTVGQIPILINVTYYTKGEGEKRLVPSFLQQYANAIAGRDVAQLPIFVSMVIFLTTILTSFIIVYGSVRSSIISIGRNPLSKKAIVSGLLQVVFLVVGLNIVGLGSIFMVLKYV